MGNTDKSNFSYIDTKKMFKDGQNLAYITGGLVVGRMMSKALTKNIEPPVVSGLSSLNLPTKTAKFLTPSLVAVSGIAAYQIGKGKGNDAVQYIGMGVGAIGLSDLFSVATNKPVLAGTFLGNVGIGAAETEPDNDGYKIIDIESGRTISPELNLPAFSGNGYKTAAHILNNFNGTEDSETWKFAGQDEDYFEDDLSGYEDEGSEPFTLTN